MRRFIVRALLAVGLAVSMAPALAAPSHAAGAGDVVDALKKIPGLKVVAESPAPSPYRFFLLNYRQPVDHRDKRKGTFEQRISLLHRDAAAPMVMHTSGYNIYETFDANGKLTRKPYLSEPTKLVAGNQISVEYRYFTPSRPQPTDWKKLTIWQAATDQHRIVTALKSIYKAHWLSTGASKGGMTATYHRRFYPRDVSGSVPYVAPNDVIDPVDSYDRFLANVGTDPQCRKDLFNAQRLALTHRTEMIAKVKKAAAAEKMTFTEIVGSADKATEMSILDMVYAFWQYGDQGMCASVPKQGASIDTIFSFFDDVSGMLGYSDQNLAEYTPYYYQAGTQLGAPTTSEKHVRDLLKYPNQNHPRSYVPKSIPMRFDYSAMPDIDAWVRTSGSQLMFVNGEYDPWSAEPFRKGPGTKDSFFYTVPKGNHGSQIGLLPEAQKAQATAAVLRWAGVSAAQARSVRMSTSGFETDSFAGTRPPL